MEEGRKERREGAVEEMAREERRGAGAKERTYDHKNQVGVLSSRDET